ncbi:hypothetical protein PY254_01910 [Rhodanobacter sp. AS-Z3]|uniref:hypothetical protein n=1 Tax=Rhodanobacter sp. AS-Z3 TaxID=3031330 RepID=UPI0024798C61|nr:hypothetical protein [Rhodanobacter sp. AS-Z3]WEN15456.1 hypothetical protein PY254_01910 [Rhodanobacter sp. AS-Z3]
MNPVPRTAMAFLLATLLSAASYPLTSGSVIAALVLAAFVLVALAVGANVKEIRAEGKSMGFTSGRVLPIAGLNFAALLTLAAVSIASAHAIWLVLVA